MSNLKYAIICEGAAEKAIINILLENDRLIINKNDLYKGQLFGRADRNIKKFCDNHLNISIDFKIVIWRILDSKREKI